MNSLGRSDTYPVPSTTIPIFSNLDLASRPELEILQQRLSCPAARVALFGIDDAHPNDCMREALDQPGITGRDDPKVDIIQLVKGRSLDSRNGR